MKVIKDILFNFAGGHPDGVPYHLKGDHTPIHTPSPMPSPSSSPKLSRMWFGITDRHFGQENNYENVNVQEMVEQLASTENLQEQADIIHFLFMKK